MALESWEDSTTTPQPQWNRLMWNLGRVTKYM